MGDCSPECADLLLRQGLLSGEAIPILRRFPTPDSIAEADYRALQRTIATDGGAPSDWLASLRESAQKSSATDLSNEIAEALVPSLVSEYVLSHDRLEITDRLLFNLARGSAPLSPPRQFAIPPGGRFDSIERSQATRRTAKAATEPPHDTRTLRERATEVIDGAIVHDREWQYASFRALYDAATPSPSDSEASTQIELAGAILALSDGDFANHRRHVDALATLHAAGEPSLRADAATVDGLGLFLFVNVEASLAKLLEAKEATPPARPVIAREGLGALAYGLLLFGEFTLAQEMLAELHSGVREEGTAEALGDAADAIVCAGRGDAAGAQQALERAALSAADGPYAAHRHYVRMVCALAGGDPGEGLRAYDDWTRLTADAPLPTRFVQQVECQRVILIAATGDIGTARAVLDDAFIQERRTGPRPFLHTLYAARLDAAAGRYDRVNLATDPHGPLGEAHLSGMQTRYAPAVLVLRGTALFENGDVEGAHIAFARALRRAIEIQEFFALVAAETPQFREWLLNADASSLGSAIDPSIIAQVIAALTAQPPLITRQLEPLTTQQLRILELLSHGHSAAAISRVLSISPNTLKTHLRMLYRRLDVSSRQQAVATAQEYGVL